MTCFYKFPDDNYDCVREILFARCPVKLSEEMQQEHLSHCHLTDSQSRLQSDSESNSPMENSANYGNTCASEQSIGLSVKCTGDHASLNIFGTSDIHSGFSEKFQLDNSTDIAKIRVSSMTTAAESPISTEDCHLSEFGADEVQFTGDEFCDNYLIFTMGKEMGMLHQIGIKRIAAAEMKDFIFRLKNGVPTPFPSNDGASESNFDSLTRIDHLFELHGCIIGACLSPDHR